MPTRMKIENKEIEISFAAKLLIMISDWRVGIGWQTANCVELEVIKKEPLGHLWTGANGTKYLLFGTGKKLQIYCNTR